MIWRPNGRRAVHCPLSVSHQRGLSRKENPDRSHRAVRAEMKCSPQGPAETGRGDSWKGADVLQASGGFQMPLK